MCQVFLVKKSEGFYKKEESESLTFIGLKIPRDYSCVEEGSEERNSFMDLIRERSGSQAR